MRSTTNNWKMPVFAWISVTWSRQMPGQLPERVPDWQSPMAIPRRRRERQHHDVPPPWLRVPRWIQRGPGMAMAAQKWAADGWWWNDAGISEAAVLIYRCQDIVIIPPPKKKHHSSDSPLEGTISTRALLIWSSNERCNWSTAQWPVPWFLWFSVEHPMEWGCALRM